MRIIVNGIATDAGGGLTVLKNFYNYLVNTGLAKEHEWIFLLSDNHFEEKEKIKVKIISKVKGHWLNRLIFDLYKGKKYISKLKPDIVFSMQNTVTFGINCPRVIYMHQSLPFQKVKKFSFFKSEERLFAFYQYLIGMMIKLSIRKADRTIVQTKWIKDAVIESTKIPENKIINIFPDYEDLSQFKENGVFDKHSFFYPAPKYIYKNHKCIFEAADILISKGINNFNIHLTINEESDKNHVISLGEIPFEEVLDMYNRSTLIFPSYIETVGLPLLEARELGSIILASDCPFSREVLDSYENAYYFDPFNPQELADYMERVISGDIGKRESENIRIQNNNSWKSVIDILISLGGGKV